MDQLFPSADMPAAPPLSRKIIYQASSRHIIRGAMIDKAHLRDKQVVFRLLHAGIYPGIVKLVEDDGFWIESPLLLDQMANDQVWKAQVERIPTPVLFVPTSSLMYLIATKE